MRKVFAGAALAFALASPAFAQSGHIDLSYANLNEDFGAGDLDIDMTRLGGAVAFDTDPVGFQFDANYANWEAGGDADVWGAGAHFYRRGLRYLVGVYGGYDAIEDNEAWTGALEGQYYTRGGTFSGALSHSDMEDNFSATSLTGRYRHFLNENLSLHGGLGLGNMEAGAVDFDFWETELGGEWRMEAAPISVFAGWRHSEFDVPGGDLDTDAAQIGVRYDFSPSLLDRDRSGAGLDRVLSVFERLLV